MRERERMDGSDKGVNPPFFCSWQIFSSCYPGFSYCTQAATFLGIGLRGLFRQDHHTLPPHPSELILPKKQPGECTQRTQLHLHQFIIRTSIGTNIRASRKRKLPPYYLQKACTFLQINGCRDLAWLVGRTWDRTGS